MKKTQRKKLLTKKKVKESESSKKINHYFSQKHEDAITKYALSKDTALRTQLYLDYIAPAFNEMVDKIVYTYKFTSLPNIDSLKDECKIWLTTLLDKYDQNKGYKAFSYYSVITKNWFVHKVKKNVKKYKQEIYYDDLSKDLEEKFLSTNNTYCLQREEEEFWKFLLEEIDRWDEMSLRENDKRVLQAIKILLGNVDNIDIFNKKAIYLYVREITKLNTKQIVCSLNKMREKYRFFKKKWNSGEL